MTIEVSAIAAQIRLPADDNNTFGGNHNG